MTLLAEREERWKRLPQGDGGDAIDYALDHVANPAAKLGFLDDWRDGRHLETKWPGYVRWLKVQRDGARAALRTRSIQEGDKG